MTGTGGPTGPQVVLEFWLEDRVRERWFRSTPQLDTEIRMRFCDQWRRASEGALGHWEATAEGCAAMAILLDQLPLNMFRGRPEAFSTEPMAREEEAWLAEPGSFKG